MRDIEQTLARVLAAASYMERHLHADLSLEDLARAAAYSPFHFVRIFRQVTGYAPMEFLVRRRLTWAAMQLIDTQVPVEKVALRAGYESPSAFARAFARQYGMSPRKYRQQRLWLWPLDAEPLCQDRLWHQLNGGIQREPDLVWRPGSTYYGIPSAQGYEVKDRRASWEKSCHLDPTEGMTELRWAKWEQTLSRGYYQMYAMPRPILHDDAVKIEAPSGWYAKFRHLGRGDHTYFHSCRYIYGIWFPSVQKKWFEDCDRPTLLHHQSTNDPERILDCATLELEIPIHSVEELVSSFEQAPKEAELYLGAAG
jgi:AraC-like DNA-binding protein